MSVCSITNRYCGCAWDGSNGWWIQVVPLNVCNLTEQCDIKWQLLDSTADDVHCVAGKGISISMFAVELRVTSILSFVKTKGLDYKWRKLPFEHWIAFFKGITTRNFNYTLSPIVQCHHLMNQNVFIKTYKR